MCWRPFTLTLDAESQLQPLFRLPAHQPSRSGDRLNAAAYIVGSGPPGLEYWCVQMGVSLEQTGLQKGAVLLVVEEVRVESSRRPKQAREGGMEWSTFTRGSIIMADDTSNGYEGWMASGGVPDGGRWKRRRLALGANNFPIRRMRKSGIPDRC